jgi:lipopolysaccharide exporter
VQILAITYAFDMFVVTVRPLGMATGNPRLLFMRQLAGLCVRVPLILIGLAVGGMVGAALGRGLANAINCFISFLIVKKLVGLSVFEQLKGHAATVAGAIVMVVLVLFLQTEFEAYLASEPHIAILVLGSAGVVTYFSTVLFIWLASGRQYGVVGEVIGTVATFPCLRIVSRMARS